MFDVPFIVVSKITWAPVIANHYSTATWLHVSLLLKVEQCVTMRARVSTPSSYGITLMLLAGGKAGGGRGRKGDRWLRGCQSHGRWILPRASLVNAQAESVRVV